MSDAVKIIPWNAPTPERENGPWHINQASFVSPEEFELSDTMLVEFGPTSWAGNHRHIQKEMLVCLSGEMVLIWRDEAGTRHEEKMRSDDNQLQAFLIDSNIPHLMENRSDTTYGTVQVWSGLSDNPVLLEGNESLR